MEADCSCLQSTKLYHTKTVTQHLSIPSLHYPTWKTLCSGPKKKKILICEENVVLIFTNYLELRRKPNHFTHITHF